ncbi:hypothetical protein [Marilutibacter spongiae]|uniref:HTH cro/C1-type domain-containing protein n=1 Tax=Marilutibacter spongiae TaxID=2025720 RepID=A0A7W3TL57_9GAMM|nr:hypothetical protein [Lysobacter spongiae]MBB1060393.1 hypothetical protein [Lysobacter spongiae]
MGRKVIPFRIAWQSLSEYRPTNGIHEHADMDQIRRNILHLADGRALNSIAIAADIQQSWLQRYMNPDKPSGIKKPNPEMLAPVAQVLGVSLSDLMTKDLTAGPVASSQPAGLNGRMIGFAIKVADYLRDISLDKVSEEQYEDFLAEALMLVQARSRLPEASDLPEVAKKVIAEIRSKARG